MSVPVSGEKAVGAVEPVVVVEYMSPVFVGGCAVSAVRSGDRVWVPLDDLHRVDGELHRVRGQLDTARVDATTAQDAAQEAERRASSAEVGQREARAQLSQMRTDDYERNMAACEWADDNDLCSRFEDFCE